MLNSLPILIVLLSTVPAFRSSEYRDGSKVRISYNSLAKEYVSEALFYSVDWAMSNPNNKDCDEKWLSAFCVLKMDGYCRRYKHKGDLLKRFECPEPSAINFRNRNIFGLSPIYLGHMSFKLVDGRVPTCRLGFFATGDRRGIFSAGCREGGRSKSRGMIHLLLESNVVLP